MKHYPYTHTFEHLFRSIRNDLVDQPSVDVGEWQSQKITTPMKELLHVVFEWQMPKTKEELGEQTGARLPWAEDHFLERVSGEPLNPSPSEAWWPFREKKDGDTNTSHKSEGKAFSHTYPERMWASKAWDSKGTDKWSEDNPLHFFDAMEDVIKPHGLRFDYGDLGDVVNQLDKSPMTRQAYLPIWFPEDTGAVHGKRVPCTLGYHFIIRDGKLDISYFMRSTDLLRHFQDDVYLAVRLAQWMVEELNAHGEDRPIYRVGNLIFHTANMHIFEGDVEMINYWKTLGKIWF